MAHPQQAQLWQEPNPPPEAGFRDPAFAANRESPVHRWVPWIAGFSQQFVQSALSTCLDRPGTVLDPFAGVGTTLVEADRVGHEAIGFEINPYAAFASRTKLKAHRMEVGDVQGAARALRRFVDEATRRDEEPQTCPPPGFRTRAAFYSPKVLRKVLFAQDFIRKKLPSESTADLFRLAFAATMVSYSNYSYEPSLGRKSAVGRPDVDDHPVAEAISAKVLQMADDIRWLQETRDPRPRPDGRILQTSFLGEGHRDIEPESVDLLITSPPYLNNYHYNRNTRPHLYWLGFCTAPADLKQLEALNFGTYWQNARDQESVPLAPDIDDAEICEAIEEVRSRNPDKGIYGGTGWANYATTYFNDCARFLTSTMWCLRPGAKALVVIGNSILQGVHIPTDRFLARIAESQGFEVIDIHIPRDTRVGNSIVNSTVRAGKADHACLYESVVELRKP